MNEEHVLCMCDSDVVCYVIVHVHTSKQTNKKKQHKNQEVN